MKNVVTALVFVGNVHISTAQVTIENDGSGNYFAQFKG